MSWTDGSLAATRELVATIEETGAQPQNVEVHPQPDAARVYLQVDVPLEDDGTTDVDALFGGERPVTVSHADAHADVDDVFWPDVGHKEAASPAPSPDPAPTGPEAPVRALEDVGSSTIDRLESAGIETLGDILEAGRGELTDIQWIGENRAASILEEAEEIVEIETENAPEASAADGGTVTVTAGSELDQGAEELVEALTGVTSVYDLASALDVPRMEAAARCRQHGCLEAVQDAAEPLDAQQARDLLDGREAA